MKKSLIIPLMFISSGAFAQFPTTEATADFGSNQIVTLEKTNKFNLTGDPISVGDYMPSVNMMTSNLEHYDTSEINGTTKVYSILTSVDTPVCVEQAIELSNYINDHTSDLKGIEFYAISADTPFAQMRFLENKKLTGFTFLSDSLSHDFGNKTGSQIKELGLLTRSIIVTDGNNKIIHTQRVPELTTIPELEKAIKIAKKSIINPS